MDGNILQEILRSFCNLYMKRHGDISVLPRDRPFVRVSSGADLTVNRTSLEILTCDIL